MLETLFFNRRSAAKAEPVAIIDIGSNSVRLVVYQSLSRAPTPIFNEKVMCGLGKGVVTSGRLPDDGVEKALKALRRYRALVEMMGVVDIEVIATAAVRDASNGPAFLSAAEEAIRKEIKLLSGRREAELSALGVVSAIHKPDGIVGDLGGGSLELIDVAEENLGKGVTLPLGGLALMDAAKRSIREAMKIARKEIAEARPLDQLKGRSFYAVGGTWRALAKLHMRQRNYPLGVMHNYRIQTNEAADFAELVERLDSEAIGDINVVSSARRPLLAYGAIVLDEIIHRAKPKDIIISAAGVREGMLYDRLSIKERAVDPLIAASRDLETLFARAPGYGDELIKWVDQFMSSGSIDETEEEIRLRHAACLLSDIAWRSHPEYRAQRALNVVTQGQFVAIDHPSRAFLTLAIVLRHEGPDGGDAIASMRSLLTTRLFVRARILGSVMRLGYILSASMPGILPHTKLAINMDCLSLSVPKQFSDLLSDRFVNRLKALGRLIGSETQINILN